MGRVIHFELCTDEFEKISDFYESCFGWTITPKKDGYNLIHTGSHDEKGINGGLTQTKGSRKGFIPTIEVKNLKMAVQRVEEKGGKVVESNKVLPGTGYLAYCTDPKGNLIVLLEYNSDAK